MAPGSPPEGAQPIESGIIAAAKAMGDAGLWSDSAGGQPTGFIYLVGTWLALLPDSTAAARALSAVAGIASVAVFFLFARRAWGQGVAVAGAFLMALSTWHVAFSRLSTPTAALLLVECAAIYLLSRALSYRDDDARQRNLLILAGLSFGLGIYIANTFFIFAASIVVFWLRELLAAEVPLAVGYRRLAAFAVPALIVALPYLSFMALKADMYVEETRSVLVTSSPLYTEKAGRSEQVRYVLAKTGNTAKALVWGDVEERSVRNRRVLDPLTGLLLVTGIFVAAARWRDRWCFFALALLAAGVISGGLTQDAGTYARLAVTMPAVFALAGVAAQWLASWSEGRLTRNALIGTAVAAGALIAVVNIVFYFSGPLDPAPDLWAQSATYSESGRWSG